MTTPGHSLSGFWEVGSIGCAVDMRDHYAARQPILQAKNQLARNPATCGLIGAIRNFHPGLDKRFAPTTWSVYE
jgi:hypothetical protein